jgi:hypothetical protein
VERWEQYTGNEAKRKSKGRKQVKSKKAKGKRQNIQ